MAKITKEGLIRKGFSEEKAEIVISKKLAWKDLQMMTDLELETLLGEPADFYIKIVRDSGRPDIPKSVYDMLMYESNRTCCICKDDRRPIIIHHIVPWEKVYKHEIDNLVVLCVLHHAEAHRGLLSGSGLLENKLAPEEVKVHKQNWLDEIKELKRKNVLGLISDDYCDWLYFNPRFMDLVQRGKVSVRQAKKYQYLLENDVIDEEGIPKPTFLQESKEFWAIGPFIRYLDEYMSSLAEEVLRKVDFVNLNNAWKSIEEVENILNENKLFVYQGRFCFTDADHRVNKGFTGTGQTRVGYLPDTLNNKSLSIEFTHDLYDCITRSAINTHLKKCNEVTIFGNSRNVYIHGGKIYIKPTVYAIGIWFNQTNKFNIKRN
jgi:hypothetical protein